MGKKKEVRNAGDAAGTGPYAREMQRLVPLSEMRGWNVIKGEADIRGWEVKTVSGRALGNVRELLVDADAGEVVMLDVDLGGTDRHSFVPIRVVEIDRARRIVRADSSDLGDSPPAHEERPAREFGAAGEVRYADASERVVDSRPMVEETVVRRRDVDPDARP
ncbi:MAG: PRC-barrel domain-containing protein [Gemmatimonadaceae bacterium]